MVRLAFHWCWCHCTDIGERNIIKYAHARQPNNSTGPPTPRQKGRRVSFCARLELARKLEAMAGLGRLFFGGSFWKSVFPLLSFYMDQSVGYSRLSWVWPRGYNHGVRQARYYTQSLCNNHTFAFNAGFPCVCKLGQGGRSWQPFSEGKNGHKSICQARINNFCDC